MTTTTIDRQALLAEFPCPDWCTADHTNDNPEAIDGLLYHRTCEHELVLDEDYPDEETTLRIQVRAAGLADVGPGFRARIDPAHIYLEPYGGTVDPYELTADQAQQIGEMFLEAARRLRELPVYPYLSDGGPD